MQNGHDADGVVVLTEAEMTRLEMAEQEVRRGEAEAAAEARNKAEAAAIEAEIDARIEAELQAKRAAMRDEIRSRMQREKDKAHYDQIAARGREIEREQEAFDAHPDRLTEFDASRKAMREKLAKADERFRAEQDERERALNAFRAKPRQPRKLDEHGFEIR